MAGWSFHAIHCKNDEDKVKQAKTKEHVDALRDEVIKLGVEHKKAAENESLEKLRSKKILTELRKHVNVEHVQELEERVVELEKELAADKLKVS